MAFAKGNESTDGAQIKRYVGVGSVYVRDINPDKTALEKFYDRTIETEPDYLSVNADGIPQIRLDFMVELDSSKYKTDAGEPLEMKNRVTFFLRKTPRVSTSGKYQIIDKYGRTAWCTEQELESKQAPVYSTGTVANIDMTSARKAYSGEEELIKFLIAYLNIPAPQRYIDGKWVMNPPEKLKDSEAMLEDIDKYFKGDVSELKNILKLQPNNRLKVCFGIRTGNDGREFQTAYTRMFLKNNTTDYGKLGKDISDAQGNGAFPNCVFEACDIHEYVVRPTDLSTPQAPANDPFGPAVWQ